VNQAVSSLGSTAGNQLIRATLGQQIREATRNSRLARDLGRVSIIARSAASIQASLAALQSSRSDPNASVRHIIDIHQELASRGLSQSPLALFMTDLALQYIGTVEGDALAQLDRQLQSMTRQLEIESSNTITPKPAPQAVPRGADCSILQDEQQNRRLMEGNPSRWLELVQQCAPR
jgi:hypothetical protein